MIRCTGMQNACEYKKQILKKKEVEVREKKEERRKREVFRGRLYIDTQSLTHPVACSIECKAEIFKTPPSLQPLSTYSPLFVLAQRL
jgi:hypothetical protein